MKRKARWPLLMASLMALAAAVPVRAAEPTTIPLPACDFFEGGEWARRMRRSEVTVLGPTWFTKYRRQAVKFLARTHVELAIDGIPVANADLLWSRPFQEDTSDPNSAWGVNWEDVLGRLGAGNSVDVNYKLVTDQTHWDGWASNPPGVTAELNCRVSPRAADQPPQATNGRPEPTSGRGVPRLVGHSFVTLADRRSLGGDPRPAWSRVDR